MKDSTAYPSVVLCATVALQSAAAANEPCQEPPTNAVFQDVAQAANELSCNETGHWEAHFGSLQVFVHVPGGEFTMGSEHGLDDERPVRTVQLDGYWIDKYPVTVAQFREFVADTGYLTDAERGWGAWQWTGVLMDTPETAGDPWALRMDGRWNNLYFEQGDDHPVGSVSWNDANAYAAWLSRRLGVSAVLPTEAQWEKAARGTDARRFPWGDAAPDGTRGNYADSHYARKYGRYARRPEIRVDDGYVETSPVDAYPLGQSPYGVFDLAGNLGEWVYDVYDSEYYGSAPAHNPTGPTVAAGVPDQRIDRVNRGGSWVDWAGVSDEGEVQPVGGHNLRAAARTGDEQNSSDDHMGFRLAVDGLRSAETKSADPFKPDLSGVFIETYEAAGNVFMLEASGDVAGNIAALVGPDGILIVDDQFAELTPSIESALWELHPGDLRYIINTHHHDDHSDGNARLAAAGGAVIVAHDIARERLQLKGPGHWPVLTFDATMTIHFNDEVVRLLAIPGGHTDNDVVVFFERANVVHLGDLMNSGISSFPLADLDAGGNALRILDNIAMLLAMIDDDAVIIPGHGPLSDKPELQRLLRMLQSTIETVREKRARDESLESIVAAGVADEYRDWGYGHTSAEDWLTMIYMSLSTTEN